MCENNDQVNFLVYKTTNSVNGNYYIGVHKQRGTEPDGYLGSGVVLSLAVKKYSKSKFLRETLYSFSTKEEAYSKEQDIVSEETIKDPKCYNLLLGGKGGGDFKHLTPEDRKKAKINSNKTLISRYGNNWSQLHIEDARAKAHLRSSLSRKSKYGDSLLNLNNLETQSLSLSSRVKSLNMRYKEEMPEVDKEISVYTRDSLTLVWTGSLLLINKDFESLDHPQQSIREVRRVWKYLNKTSAYPYFKFRGVKYIAKFVEQT